MWDGPHDGISACVRGGIEELASSLHLHLRTPTQGHEGTQCTGGYLQVKERVLTGH